MAKTKEMLYEQYLEKYLSYQLQTWLVDWSLFVDWSWDPQEAYCFWTLGQTFMSLWLNQKKCLSNTSRSTCHINSKLGGLV